tara:strand:- start:543 stop:653 length:111 start_codon:yes stop_codon:yes gene_type:complete
MIRPMIMGVAAAPVQWAMVELAAQMRPVAPALLGAL